jgi:hypothetical protein
MNFNNCIKLCKHAFRENVFPAIYLQCFAIILVSSYYFIPQTKSFWSLFTQVKDELGIFFIAGMPILCGGFIPLFILIYQKKVAKQVITANIIFCILFWGYRGTEINYLYEFFAYLFGDSTNIDVIVKKVLCDQFIYSFLWSGPTAAIAFKYKANDFNWFKTKQQLNMRFFTEEMAATIFSIWMIWIPAVTIIYTLPLELQYIMFNIVLCFFSLILSSIQKNN